MQRTLELSYDRLVIGSDLSAFAFCYEHQCPAIYSRVLRPYEYNESQNWDRQIQIWNELAYAISERFLPFSDKIVSLRIEDDHLLKAVTKGGIVCKIKFGEIFISDDYGVEGLPTPTGKTSTDNWVIDWFNVNRGAKHAFDYLVDPHDNFVNKIYFYISKRFYKNATKKDLLTVSKISDEQLHSDEYDQNVARLKTISMMKAAGIKGSWDITNKRYLLIKLTSVKRDIYPLGKNIYTNLPANIKLLY